MIYIVKLLAKLCVFAPWREIFYFYSFTVMKKKQKEFVHISGIVDNLLKTLRSEPDKEMLRVWSLWDNAVGKTIAENARPAAFKGKLLVVHVISSTWLHQLQFLKKEITTKVNNALGNELIEEIVFKIGSIK